MEMHHILLVDGCQLVLRSLGPFLESQGYRVTTADNGKDATRLIERKTFDIVIADTNLKALSGIEIFQEIKRVHPGTVTILLTGSGDTTHFIKVLRPDVDDFLLKPFEPDEICFRIKRCIEILKLKQRLR
jgi:two-component system response regulator GlrR